MLYLESMSNLWAEIQCLLLWNVNYIYIVMRLGISNDYPGGEGKLLL